MSRNSSLKAMHSALMTQSGRAEVFVVAPDVYGLLWPSAPDGVTYSGASVYVGGVLVVPGRNEMRVGSIELHSRGVGYDSPAEIYMVAM